MTHLAADVNAGLIAATVRGPAACAGPALLVRLIEAGYVRPADALADLQAVGSDGWRSALALVPLLETADREAAADLAVAAARTVPGRPERAKALHAVGSALGEPTVVAEALDAIDGYTDQHTHWPVLADLAPGLPASLRDRAAGLARATAKVDHRAKNLFAYGLFDDLLALIRANPGEWFGHDLLVKAAPMLPPALLPEAVDVAGALRVNRGVALAGLRDHVTGPLRETVVAGAIADAVRLRDDRDRAFLLAGLAADLPPALLDDVVTLAASLPAWRSASGTHARLAPHVTPEQRQRLLLAALSNVEGKADARACADLVPYLDPAQVDTALAGILADRVPNWRAQALTDLLTVLPDRAAELAAQAFAAALADGRPNPVFPVAGRLAPHLSPADLRALVTTVRTMATEHGKPGVYGELAPHLPADLLAELLDGIPTDLATAYRPERARAQAVEALAPHLPDALLPAALTTDAYVGDEDTAAEALAALVAAAPDAVDAAALLDRSGGPSPRLAAAWAEAGLAAYLPPDRVADLATALAGLPEHKRRVAALAMLLPHLDDVTRPGMAATVAGGIWAGYDVADVVELVAPYLTERQRATMLDAAYDPDDGPHDLARFLDRTQLARELSAVDGTDDDFKLMRLRPLLPYLPDDLVPVALDAARDIHDPGDRAVAVSELLDRLDPAEAHTVWRTEWHRAQDHGPWTKDRIRTALARYAPTGERAAAYVLAAGPDAYNRRAGSDHLHGLLPGLPEEVAAEVRAELLQRALRTPKPEDRALALVRLDPPRVGDAVAAARQITDPDDRQRVFGYLRRHLPATVLVEVLDDLATIPPSFWLGRHFADLIESLPADRLNQAADLADHPDWDRHLPLVAVLRRAHELWRTDPTVPIEAIARRVTAGRDRAGWRALVPALAPILADLEGPAAVRTVAETVADLQRTHP